VPFNKVWARKEKKKLIKSIKLILNTDNLSDKAYAKIPWPKFGQFE
jgi:hypothetical protein